MITVTQTICETSSRPYWTLRAVIHIVLVVVFVKVAAVAMTVVVVIDSNYIFIFIIFYYLFILFIESRHILHKYFFRLLSFFFYFPQNYLSESAFYTCVQLSPCDVSASG